MNKNLTRLANELRAAGFKPTMNGECLHVMQSPGTDHPWLRVRPDGTWSLDGASDEKLIGAQTMLSILTDFFLPSLNAKSETSS